MREIRVAAIQMSFTWDLEDNLKRVEAHIRRAAADGAQVILASELFHGPYFCQEQDGKYYELAYPLEESPPVLRMRKLAKELGVALPVSFFEKADQAHFNSMAMVDADGSVLGVYRKSHIPDGPGYEEKWYFSPGDTGFKVWKTRFGRVGVGICWDQWFPECARAMALEGAEILMYPTAIGSEPEDPTLDSHEHWRRVMQGHAAANLMPVIAANRHGLEKMKGSEITFYGTSFIAGPTGEIVADAKGAPDAIIHAKFDLDAVAQQRASWGLFRDRRPDLYGPLLTLDGGPK